MFKHVVFRVILSFENLLRLHEFFFVVFGCEKIYAKYFQIENDTENLPKV
eukprot:TRINITY_DN34_c0_g1_i1.p2 TRINITY_DN34_c0_g1~~TRINITY_DN34_c0_g1_i1.p2  ORF type:complete len:50 (-),score=10.45 TRINITY_DN34_c0_g1_i1:159-308(-)